MVFFITPGFQNWCDHWKQCVWFAPEIGSLTLRDTNVHLQAIQNITSISFRLKSNAGIEESYHENNNAGNYKINLLPERIGIYGDKDYRTAFLTAARNTVRVSKNTKNCLFLKFIFHMVIIIRKWLLTSYLSYAQFLCIVAGRGF